MPSLVGRENLLRRVRFPRLVVPLSVALFCFFNLCMNLIVVFIFILAAGIDPRWSWLELIPLVGLLVIFAAGVGMLLRRCTCAFATSSRSGKSSTAPVLRLADPLHGADGRRHISSSTSPSRASS